MQHDAVLYNDTWDDSSWDSVWDSAVSVDDQGWTAELRIPLSQLRFTFGERQTWGVNAMRFIRRKNERAWLELVPKNENGLASRMAHLTGLDGLRPKRHLELLPYTAARAEFVQPARVGNPFNDGSRAFAAAGIDLKWGVTSNLTLDGTVNPDFGQVEVDPAVVNLTQFETFFPGEAAVLPRGRADLRQLRRGRRQQLLGVQHVRSRDLLLAAHRPDAAGVAVGRIHRSAGGDDDSRRREAHRQDPERLEHGAARTPSPTARPRAPSRRRSAASRPSSRSPTTSWCACSATSAAAPAPGSSRRPCPGGCDTPAMRDSLASSAYVFGGDGYWFLDADREWVVTGKLAGSWIQGTTTTITRAQRAAQRYFQRPDAPHVTLDPDAHLARRLHRPGQPQSQQRPAARQRRALGRQPGLRIERPRVSSAPAIASAATRW